MIKQETHAKNGLRKMPEMSNKMFVCQDVATCACVSRTILRVHVLCFKVACNKAYLTVFILSLFASFGVDEKSGAWVDLDEYAQKKIAQDEGAKVFCDVK